MKLREFMIATAAGLTGAGLMYFLDPAKGRSRRALLRDKTKHACLEAARNAEGVRSDVVNRSIGFLAEAQHRLDMTPVGDEVLVQRVRAKLGRVVSHPHDITVTADQGCVTLTGRIAAFEGRHLSRIVARVAGVHDVLDHLHLIGKSTPLTVH